MAGGHGRSHLKDQLLAAVSRIANSASLCPKATTAGRTAAAQREIFEIPSGQRVDSIQQVFLAGDPGDLIAQLAVLEKE
jgi:hypothetical protein